MTYLLRASEITKRPVVTFAGEDVAQVKDLVYSAGGGELGGFTLAGRGLFAGPLKSSLRWADVAGLGGDAVMIASEDALVPQQDLFDRSASSGGSGGDVIGSQVLTDAGTDLGTVVDVIVEVPDDPGGRADVVGYEIESSQSLGNKGAKVLIPLPDTISASGRHLMVPASAKDFVGHDLAGFGASVLAFRAQLAATS